MRKFIKIMCASIMTLSLFGCSETEITSDININESSFNDIDSQEVIYELNEYGSGSYYKMSFGESVKNIIFYNVNGDEITEVKKVSPDNETDGVFYIKGILNNPLDESTYNVVIHKTDNSKITYKLSLNDKEPILTIVD